MSEDKRLSKASQASVSSTMQSPHPANLSSTKAEDQDAEIWKSHPAHPRNWSKKKKWTAVLIVSLYTIIPPLASSLMAPGLPDIARHYHITNSTVLPLTVSIFMLSFGLGPLVLAPLSEMYGRTWILHIANLAMLAFHIGCAYSPTTGSLIAFRFLAGLSGSAPLAVGGGTISDLFNEQERAAAMGIYTLGPLLGPSVGPVIGGFVAQELGIKWLFLLIAIFCGGLSVIGIPLLRETYAPVVRRHLSTDPEFKLRTEEEAPRSWKDIWFNLKRPIVMLTTSFVCFIISLYMAFLFGVNFLMFTTFPTFFATTYGFKAGVAGLAYLGLGVGFILAIFLGVKMGGAIYNKLVQRNGGVATPEMRIPGMALGAVCVPIGLFWYGWSAQAKLHWIMPIIGSSFFGFGMMSTFFPLMLYLVDSYTYAASAVSAATLFRCLLGFAFPLFGDQLFKKLTIGGGNSLLAGLAILLGIPFPVYIYYKGAELRARSGMAN